MVSIISGLFTEFVLEFLGHDTTASVGVLEAHLDSSVSFDSVMSTVHNYVCLVVEILPTLVNEVIDSIHGSLAVFNAVVGLPPQAGAIFPVPVTVAIVVTSVAFFPGFEFVAGDPPVV